MDERFGLDGSEGLGMWSSRNQDLLNNLAAEWASLPVDVRNSYEDRFMQVCVELEHQMEICENEPNLLFLVANLDYLVKLYVYPEEGLKDLGPIILPGDSDVTIHAAISDRLFKNTEHNILDTHYPDEKATNLAWVHWFTELTESVIRDFENRPKEHFEELLR